MYPIYPYIYIFRWQLMGTGNVKKRVTLFGLLFHKRTLQMDVHSGALDLSNECFITVLFPKLAFH